MSRSGIFQIAFDHDRYGHKSIKQELSGTEAYQDEDTDTDRSVHEQRLQIDHPDFFCGQGDTPPVGVDNSRPRGAWYLHQRAAVPAAAEQEQRRPVSEPASPPGAFGRSSQNFGSSSSAAFPQSHAAWGPTSHGDNGEDLGSSAVAAAAQANADATDMVQRGCDPSDLRGA